jgi:hypothetical protein
MSTLDQALRQRLRRDYGVEGMEELFLRLDLLHDYAAAGRLDEITPLSRAELRAWIKELIYTARETLREIDALEFVGDLEPARAAHRTLLEGDE